MTTILLVEDDDDLAEVLSTVLAKAGLRVVRAASAEVGLELALARSPDLIVTDLCLPGIDGGEMLRRVRRCGDDAPALLISASGAAEAVARALAVAFVAKPFLVADFLAAVARLLDSPRRRD